MLELREESVADLRQHACIPSTFESQFVYDVREGPDGFELAARAVDPPYRKDYDSVEDPLAWSDLLCAATSIRICAFVRSHLVGSVIAVIAKPGLVRWEHRSNIAILWDLRVAPAHRRQSVATSLLRAVQAWAQQIRCSELKVETQNTNPAACQFYIRSGFALQSVQRGAYSSLPADVQLIWRKRLDG